MSYQGSRGENVGNDWSVVHCISSEEGEEVRVLRLRVSYVPEACGRKQIKTALERAGRVFGEGDYLWGNHRILPRDEWLDLDQTAVEAITYADLLDEAKGEKRVTVRFPIGLHNALVKAARGKSFNQFCIDVMGAAIGYEQEPLAPALPRLAQSRGISEAEMAEKVTAMIDAMQERRASPPGQKMGEHFANIAGLPLDQQKQMLAAFYGDPQRVKEIQDAVKACSNFSDKEFAEMSEKLGISVEEVRRSMEKLRTLPDDFVNQGINGLKEASPELIKDKHLLLRDVFTGTNNAAPES